MPRRDAIGGSSRTQGAISMAGGNNGPHTAGIAKAENNRNPQSIEPDLAFVQLPGPSRSEHPNLAEGRGP